MCTSIALELGLILELMGLGSCKKCVGNIEGGQRGGFVLEALGGVSIKPHAVFGVSSEVGGDAGIKLGVSSKSSSMRKIVNGASAVLTDAHICGSWEAVR
jgi:hypothetical protein